MTDPTSLHLKYIKDHVIDEIVEKFHNEKLKDYEVNTSTGLDGFMSALYTIKLRTQTLDGKPVERLVIAKFMRGDYNFRVSSKSFIQFANEIFVYAEILPAYERLLQECDIADPKVSDWIADVYVAKFGHLKGLNTPTPNIDESLLVLKHLQPEGYGLGARLYLTREQLLGMCKPLGEYHGVGYAMRYCKPNEYARLKNGIIPLPFINESDPDDKHTNIYRVLYSVAYERFFDYYDRKSHELIDKQSQEDVKLAKTLARLREKYYEEPARLMEHLRTSVDLNEADERFSIILHGDFNRNNILFRPKTRGGEGDTETEQIDSVKMIDFQELRVGTPAIDLSFVMYMNMPDNLRTELWSDVLKTYHSHLHKTLKKILVKKCPAKEVEKILDNYNFENFNAHFKRFAFYGAMVSLHFQPWILCNEEECAELSRLFESDMHGEAFRRISIDAGGDAANHQVFKVVRHACAMGYMDSL